MGNIPVSSPDPGGVMPVFSGSYNVPFGEKAIKSSVNVSGLSKGLTTGDARETDGTYTCTGVDVHYTVQTQEWFGTGWYRYSAYKPATISGSVSYTKYEPAPSPPPPPEPESPIAEVLDTSEGDVIAEEIDNSEDEEKVSQWITRQVLLAEGINEKRVDTYHKNDLRFGEVCSQEDFVSPYIESVEQARYIADHLIYDSTKNLNISASVPPILTAELGDWCEVINTHNFIDEIERIQAIEIIGNHPGQEVKWYFNIREDEE